MPVNAPNAIKAPDGVKAAKGVNASNVGHAVLLLCTLAVIWGVLGLHLWEEQRRSLRDAETRTANLARAFEETVSRSIALLDQALEFARASYLLDPKNFQAGPWLADKIVLRRISVQIGIIDAAGILVTTSAPASPIGLDLSDREHFVVHTRGTIDRLFISKPLIGRASRKLSVQLTRRIANPDGGFAGVAVASLDPRVLGRFRESATVGEGFALLIGHDGVIRAAQPDQDAIGGVLAGSFGLSTARALGDVPSGDGTVTMERGDAIVSYRNVTGYPLYVAIGISRDSAFKSYREARLVSLMAGGVLSLIVLFVGAIAMRQRRRLTRFHHALTLTLENISQGILMVDPKRHMPVVNHRVAELLGLPPELARPGADFDKVIAWQAEKGEFRTGSEHADHVAGDNDYHVAGDNDYHVAGDNAERIGHMAANGGIDPAMAFYERTRANGTVLEVRTTVLPDGSAVRTFTDVTERKRIERELARARDAAEAGARARTEFLAVMSHEIRTPINGIIGASGLLRDMRMAPEQREYVRIIRDSSDHLATLIQDVLDFSRLDAGKLDLEEIVFDPRALIQSTMSILGGAAHAKGLYLTAHVADEVPAWVSGDPFRLRQVLVNLIGNGIKFTASGGVATGLEATASGDGIVVLTATVKDSGIGIDPANRPKLFSAFSQVDSSISRRFGGTGLGLAICRHLVGLMGGSIRVESPPEGGSVFRFEVRLRVAAAPPAAPVAEQPGQSRPRSLSILLAEDNPTNRLVATRMLTRMGHRVEAVENGARAIAAAAAKTYDVILMDMMMPEVDGLEATRAIRSGPMPGCDVPIVGLTANALASDRAACEAAGMTGFVTKPIVVDRLRAALEQAAPIWAPESAAADGAQPPPDTRSPDATGLDLSFLAQLAEEIGPDGAAEVIHAFLEDAPGRVAAIQRAMADGAILTIRREAHALAGAARNVGLTPLGEAAYALQKASEGAGPDAAAVDALAGLLRDVIPAATAWAKARDAPIAIA